MSEAQRLTRIDLLRHGQPEGGECLRGHVDPQLTELGWQQMRAAVAACQGDYQQVISSDLRRCLSFARELSHSNQLPLSTLAQWREIAFGDWDGQSYPQLWQQVGEALGRYWEDPWAHTPPGGEPMTEFARRIEAAWDALVAEHSGQTVLLVTHGGVIRHLLARLLRMPLPGNTHLSALSLPYAARVRIEIWHDPNGQHWPRVIWPEPPLAR